MAPSITSMCRMWNGKRTQFIILSTCTLVKIQQKQFEQIQRNPTVGPTSSGEHDNDFIYFNCIGWHSCPIVWGLSDTSYWEL